MSMSYSRILTRTYIAAVVTVAVDPLYFDARYLSKMEWVVYRIHSGGARETLPES